MTLRAESVKGQLSGSIPSTTAAQNKDGSSLIDASHIDLSDMGQFMGGGFETNSTKSGESSESGESAK